MAIALLSVNIKWHFSLFLFFFFFVLQCGNIAQSLREKGYKFSTIPFKNQEQLLRAQCFNRGTYLSEGQVGLRSLWSVELHPSPSPNPLFHQQLHKLTDAEVSSVTYFIHNINIFSVVQEKSITD